jgi:hypothetical protein
MAHPLKEFAAEVSEAWRSLMNRLADPYPT